MVKYLKDEIVYYLKKYFFYKLYSKDNFFTKFFDLDSIYENQRFSKRFNIIKSFVGKL